MRILHCISTMHPSYGGPVHGVRSLSEELIRMGHKVSIATLDAANCRGSSDGNAQIHALGPGFSSYRYSRRFVRWLKENHESFDVVIVNGTWRFSSLGAWMALRGTGKPFFLYTHGGLDPFLRRFPWKELKKLVFWTLFEHRVFRDARAVIFTSEDERRRARNRFLPYRVTEVVTRYGVTHPPPREADFRARFATRYPELRGKRILLFVGRIHPEKGCDVLLDAFATVRREHQDAHLLMVGPDQVGLKARLVRLTRQLGVAQDVTWAGEVYGTEKWPLFYNAEVFVLPSHHENFSIATAEALGCGLPVIITDKVGVHERIGQYRCGFVADDAAHPFAAALRSYLSLDEKEREEMRAAARRCFLECFDIPAAAQALLETAASFGVCETATSSISRGLAGVQSV